MVSLLDSQIKTKVAKAFKGKLTRGTFRRSSAGGLDANGDPTTATVTSYAFEGIQESFSARYKAQSGIPATDVSILLLQGSLNPATVITYADENQHVFLNVPWNKWYKIRAVLEIDPAGATARFQAYEVPAP